MNESKTVNRNLEIRGLPIATDKILNTLAMIRGMTKRDLIREALNEYASNHKGEIAGLVP
jgi:hypothetical protein